MLPLDGAWTRINSAFMQTRSLETEFQRFYDSPSCCINQVADPQTGQKRAIYQFTQQFPGHWGSTIVAIVHELRSALDIAQVMATEKGSPLSEAGKEPVLGLVHALTTIDPARVELCRRQTHATRWQAVRGYPKPCDVKLTMGNVEDGAVLAAWVPVDPLCDDVDVEFDIRFEVGFGDTIPALSGKGVITVLDTLLIGVRDAISVSARTLDESPAARRVLVGARN